VPIETRLLLALPFVVLGGSLLILAAEWGSGHLPADEQRAPKALQGQERTCRPDGRCR
jgi:hypothetical protein